jgi:signal transduction histidine kinase
MNFKFACKFFITSIYLYLILNYPSATFASDKESKNILVLFTMSQGIVAYDLILQNLKTTIEEGYHKPFKIFVEYFDVGRFPDSSYQKYLFERYNQKYKNTKLDLLVAVGPKIIPIIDKYAEAYIRNLTTISIDFKDPFNDSVKYSLHSKTKEIFVEINVKKTIELAFRLFPDYESIYLISGGSGADKFYHRIAMAAAKDFENSKNINDISDITMRDLLKIVSEIPDKTIILVLNFTGDANGVSYTTPETVRLIRRNTSAPIFVLIDTPFDEGALGGYVISMRNVGTEAGIAALQILNGVEPHNVVVNEKKINQYMFDWHELKRFNLVNSELIPENSVIINEDIDFLGNYKWILAGGFLFIILQTILIVNLVRLNRKQKLTTAKLIETENRFRELAREDRILRMGELTASLSHELNQPLTAIRNSAQAGLRFIKTGKLDQAMIDEILQNIVEDNKRAAEVLSSIRQLMKLEKREKQVIDLNLIIKQVADIFRGESNKKNIRLRLSFNDDLVYILGDKTQIQQVTLNFLSNALHAIEDRSDGKKEIDIIEKIDNEKVTISVRDYGVGIDETIKNNLFKPFVTTRENGFGIGLAISKTIIDEHEGKIWAENNPDAGATFSFQLDLWNNEQNK